MRYSKASRRKARQSFDVGLDVKPRRKKRGKARMVEIEASKPTLEARARMNGVSIKEAANPIYGIPAGMAIAVASVNDTEASALWAMFKALDGANEAYSRRVIGQRRFPNVSKIEFIPDRFEANPDETPDLRSDDEKHRAAVKAWGAWEAKLNCLAKYETDAIMHVVRGYVEPHRDGGITTAGQAFVRAMRILREIDGG